jgi:glyoxylase-like metal-dependent hydrolase (beta-lactamase superfamily II)
MAAYLNNVHTLDLNFAGLPGTIAAYLIPHAYGAVLVECGPGSTLKNLKVALQSYDLTPADITDVLLTHIHLDHGGAAGWWARQGARIHVHPIGAPHLVDPDRLLVSAQRIYGDQMDNLWGEFLPVPEEKIVIHEDGEIIKIEGLKIRAVDTPGHAFHHFVYIFEDILFTGDIGGIRIANSRHIRLPMPPPELHLELWRESIRKLSDLFDQGAFGRIAPTHFGIFPDAGWHLSALLKLIDEVETWIEKTMAADPSVEELNQQFISWTENRSRQIGLPIEEIRAFEAANPSGMSAGGISRYWRKVRQRPVP